MYDLETLSVLNERAVSDAGRKYMQAYNGQFVERSRAVTQRMLEKIRLATERPRSKQLI